MSSNVTVRGGLVVKGSFVLDNASSNFPVNPKIGEFAIKGTDLYAYVNLNGLVTWYPMIRDISNSYVHTQGVASVQWNVTHSLATLNPWFIIKDDEGTIISPAGVVSIDENTTRFIFSEAVAGVVVIVGSAAISVPTINTSLLQVGPDLTIGTGGITYQGSSYITAAEVNTIVVNSTEAQITAGLANAALDASAKDAVIVDDITALLANKANKAGNGDVNFNAGTLTVTGDILPTSTSVQNIGSPTNRFKGIYVDDAYLSLNTLYIGDTPFMGTEGNSVEIKGSINQYVSISTSGSGKTSVSSSLEVGLTAPNVIVTGNSSITGTQSVGGDLTVTGSLTVNGPVTHVNSTTVSTKDNMIVLNDGQVGSGVSAGLAGISVDRGSLPQYQIVFDEADDMFKVGMENELQTLASQEYVIDSANFVQNAAADDATTKANAAQTNAIAASTPIAHIGTNGSAHGLAVASGANGFMSGSDKTKLDGIEVNANNYVLPMATATVLGGVKQGTNITIDGAGVISAPFSLVLASTGTPANLAATASLGVALTAAKADHVHQLPAMTYTGDVSGTRAAGSSSVAMTLPVVATAGTFRSVTVNAKGLVTAGTNPTTLAGYGITDAVAISSTAPASLAAAAAVGVGATAARADHVHAFTGLPYDHSTSTYGKPTAAEVVYRHRAGRAFTLPANLANSKVIASTAAAASSVFSVKKNGTQVATFTFAAAGVTATYSTQALVSFAIGDLLTITAPATADANLADIDYTILATLN